MPQSVYITAPIEPFEASVKHLRIPKTRQKKLLAILDRAWERSVGVEESPAREKSMELWEAGDRVRQEVAEAIEEADPELEPIREVETGKKSKSASAA